MSKIIASAAIRGAHKILADAEKKWRQAMDKWGPNEPVGFPNTAYYLPVIYGILGIKVEKLGDMEAGTQELPAHPAAAGQRDASPALPGAGPGCRDGHLLRRRDHRGDPLSGAARISTRRRKTPPMTTSGWARPMTSS